MFLLLNWLKCGYQGMCVCQCKQTLQTDPLMSSICQQHLHLQNLYDLLQWVEFSFLPEVFFVYHNLFQITTFFRINRFSFAFVLFRPFQVMIFLFLTFFCWGWDLMGTPVPYSLTTLFWRWGPHLSEFSCLFMHIYDTKWVFTPSF